jgi:hypothetical protein
MARDPKTVEAASDDREIESAAQHQSWSVYRALSAVVWIGATLWVGYQVSWFVSLLAVVAFVAIVLIRIPAIETSREFVDFSKWLLILIAFWITFFVVDDFQPRDTEFFAVAAQVIPVLVLALVLEGRFFGFHDKSDMTTALVVVLLLGWGEYEALRAVAQGGGAEGAGAAVSGAVAAGFVGVLAGAFGRGAESPASREFDD